MIIVVEKNEKEKIQQLIKSKRASITADPLYLLTH